MTCVRGKVRWNSQSDKKSWHWEEQYLAKFEKATKIRNHSKEKQDDISALVFTLGTEDFAEGSRSLPESLHSPGSESGLAGTSAFLGRFAGFKKPWHGKECKCCGSHMHHSQPIKKKLLLSQGRKMVWMLQVSPSPTLHFHPPSGWGNKSDVSLNCAS